MEYKVAILKSRLMLKIILTRNDCMYPIVYGWEGHFLFKCQNFANLMTNAQNFTVDDLEGNYISSAILLPSHKHEPPKTE